MGKTIYAADLFAGAGGTSTGILQAAEARGYRVCDTEEEAAAWMRYFHAQGWVVKFKRIVRVIQ